MKPCRDDLNPTRPKIEKIFKAVALKNPRFGSKLPRTLNFGLKNGNTSTLTCLINGEVLINREGGKILLLGRLEK